MRLWTLAAKLPDLDAEIAFVRALGGELVLDDVIPFSGQQFRVPLVRFGDTYLHLAERMVYESRLDGPLGDGLCHAVFEVANLEDARARAVGAGACEVAPLSRISAGFGTRDVAFLRSPGGILFELIRIIDDRVPRPR